MNEEILISVVMPVYNTEESMLRESIESILNQTYQNFEFIIVNDASNEDTTAVIESYKDERIRHVRNDVNMGVTKSLNRGLDLANGKYIARMDADDISLPQRFELQLQYMEAHKEVVVLGSMAQIIGEETIVFHKYTEDHEIMRIRLSFRNDGVIHPTAFLRADKIGMLRYDETVLKGQDYEFWTRCIELGEIRLLPKVLLHYRVHANQISTKNRTNQVQYADVTRLRMLERVGRFDEEQKQLYLDLCKQNTSRPLGEYDKLVKRLIAENKRSQIYDAKKYLMELRVLLFYIARDQKFRNGASAILQFFYPTTLLYFLKQFNNAEHKLVKGKN